MNRVQNEAFILTVPVTGRQSSLWKERNSKRANNAPRITQLNGWLHCVWLGFFYCIVLFVQEHFCSSWSLCGPSLTLPTMPCLRSSTMSLERETGSTLHNSRGRCFHWSLCKWFSCFNFHKSAPWQKPWEGPPTTPPTPPPPQLSFWASCLATRPKCDLWLNFQPWWMWLRHTKDI